VQESQEQQHQADEQEDMEEIADAIHPHQAKQPHSQQNEPDFEEHLASQAPPDARKTVFRRAQ
jgi:hypothetical protein